MDEYDDMEDGIFSEADRKARDEFFRSYEDSVDECRERTRQSEERKRGKS